MRELDPPHPTAHFLAKPTGTSAVPPTWKSQTNEVKAFKDSFKQWALLNQSRRCAFCCFPLGDVAFRRSFSLDHFAPKGKSYYPQWSFEILNLLLSCWTCNSILKGRIDSVLTVRTSYAACTFTMIHPYLDRIDDHATGTYQGDYHRVAAPVPCSKKGEKTIAVFHLDDPNHLKAANQEALRVSLDRRQQRMPGSVMALLRNALAEVSGR